MLVRARRADILVFGINFVELPDEESTLPPNYLVHVILVAFFLRLLFTERKEV